MVGDIILKQDNTWLKFTDPRRVIVTEKIGNVRKALMQVEDLVNEHGWTAVGFLSYEAAPAFDPSMRVIESAGFPLLWFGLYESSQLIQSEELFGTNENLPLLHWQPDTNKDTYNTAIQKIKEQIAQGRTYQVNYTMRLHADFEADARILFAHLARGQNKYAAYLDIGDWAVCSASHELFFDLDGNVITGRPMKGTVKRGRTASEDAEISAWLHNSVKNRAENVMIVDMIRNDIGRIAEMGSVHVPDLFNIEKYPTLFQMTSTVQAKTSASVIRIFDALFPCASITGAPKVSTMNIIAGLENSSRRIYCGSIGYIAPNRKARFNVAIRTALIDKKQKKAEYGIGGGIVWDSTSVDEYGEALLKARVLTDSPQRDFSIFETLLWTPHEGYYLLERHIARMMDSADYFGFAPAGRAFSMMSEVGETHSAHSKILNLLNNLVENAASPKRVKILMNAQGALSGEVREFQPDNKVFQVCLAKYPVHASERFLFHKTTQRGTYENATVPGFDDTLLYNEDGELTEFTIGNLVVEMEGELYTPPIQCGLLAGTFRAELLQTGKIKERVIKVEELEKCSKVFLVNSVRRWVGVNVRG